MHRIRFALLVTFGSLALAAMLMGCEDPIPQDYTEEIVVQGFAISGKPLTNVRVYRTLALSDSFSLKKATIADAEVIVKEDGTDIPMSFVADTNGGSYQATDTAFRVKNGSTYTLEVHAAGRTLTGSATVPAAFGFIKPPADTLNYPGAKNETKRYDSLNISWQPTADLDLYVVAVECMDTTGYGQYLTPSTADTNRRLREEDLLDDGTLISSERTRYGFALTSSTPVVWIAFKWFGKHMLHVYAGDESFNSWYRMVGSGRRSNYDYRLGSITGGLGVWGAASEVSADLFLKKDVR